MLGYNIPRQLLHRKSADPSRLAPEDAFYAHPSSRKPGRSDNPLGAVSDSVAVRAVTEARRTRELEKRNGRHRKGQWKKLLWVKQAYPDNYTDEETFLHDLKRNPSFQQYEFWPLMSDATVIVQHLCSVVIFICCFAGIIQERVSPVSVVSWASIGTIVGWALWDFWVGQEEDAERKTEAMTLMQPESNVNANETPGMSTTLISNVRSTEHLANIQKLHGNGSVPTHTYPVSRLSERHQQRLATAKSAVLIYCALLGLSPILKSLTKSTTSDSIWAMSCWLMCINIFFFDYGGAPGAKFPASLSTNAALMSSTVLASRLPSTTHVFSLTLFSIEVFGLFPVFRRHLRHESWRYHLLLTICLVISASAGVGLAVSGGGWKAATAGVGLGGILTLLSMGVCSWWLIGLQKYKNEIHGPWDPARPIIRRRWD